MAELTYLQLKQRVARRLGVVAQTETLSAEDGELIGTALVSVQDTLERLGVTRLDVENGIEEPYAEPVAAMAAALLVDDFQLSEPRRSQLLAQGAIGAVGRSLAERQLRALVDGLTVKLRAEQDWEAP